MIVHVLGQVLRILDLIREIHDQTGRNQFFQLAVIDDQEIAQISCCRSCLVQLIAGNLRSKNVQCDIELILNKLSIPPCLLALIIGCIVENGNGQRFTVIYRLYSPGMQPPVPCESG